MPDSVAMATVLLMGMGGGMGVYSAQFCIYKDICQRNKVVIHQETS